MNTCVNFGAQSADTHSLDNLSTIRRGARRPRHSFHPVIPDPRGSPKSTIRRCSTASAPQPCPPRASTRFCSAAHSFSMRMQCPSISRFFFTAPTHSDSNRVRWGPTSTWSTLRLRLTASI
eukprot:scaffold27248_cov62-Phaeocystis_antarctica.AAC.2